MSGSEIVSAIILRLEADKKVVLGREGLKEPSASALRVDK